MAPVGILPANRCQFVIKKGFYIILFISVFVSCTSNKNTSGTRFYHSLNTRYNIYFNGNEAFKEALKEQNKNYQEDYSDFIYMYPVSSLPKNKETVGGPFDRTIEKAAKAIKQHSIKTKPDKKAGKSKDAKYQQFMKREEYNPYLYHSWLSMAKAQFYNGDFLTASSTFSYISRHYAYDDPKISCEAQIWQARCYSEMEWFYEAENLLKKVNNENMPKQLSNLFSSVYADYLIKTQEYKDAVPYLSTAIHAEKNKTQKNRMKYLLGQIYASLGDNNLAYKAFGEVAGSSAPYPLTFSAQIRQTETYAGGNTHKMIGKLKKMAKSEKNKEFLDQVYYAMGNTYLNIPDTANAIVSYRKGAEESTRGGMDKALCLIKLGDIFFLMRDYVEAQPCYSEALGIIKKEYKDYERVSKRSEVLDELTVNSEAVYLQDSLQVLAAMPEAERMAAIDKIIEEVKRKEKEEKEKAEKEEYLTSQESMGTDMLPVGRAAKPAMTPIMPGDNSFYFYNQQTVSLGKTTFQSTWGRRKLEDNWRRKSKVTTGFEELSESPTDAIAEHTEGTIPDSTQIVEGGNEVSSGLSTDNKDPQFYLQQIPLTEEDIEASNTIIKDGLFNMGLIYKDKLEDFPLAVETFDRLINKYPENEFILDSYYHMYLIYLRQDNMDMANMYKSKIREEFPESDYAIAMADPNYEYNIRMMDVVQDSIYEETYKEYLDGKSIAVRENYQLVREKYAQTKLMPKFMFLNALSYIQTHEPEEFKKLLTELLEKYPDADVSVLAGDILKGLASGRNLSADSSPMKGMIFNIRFGAGEDSMVADSTLKFSEEINTAHTMMLIYPKGSVNENQLLFNVAGYNFGNFMIKEFDLVFETFGNIGMLQIQGFSNFEEIMQYNKMIYESGGYAKGLDPQVIVMPISVDNYGILMKGKSLDEYIDFFEMAYGKNYPAIVQRWKSKQEAEIEKEEKELEKPEEGKIETIPAETQIPPVEIEPDSTHTIDVTPPIKPVISDSIHTVQPEITEKGDSTLLPRPAITEEQLEENVNKAAQGVSEGMDKLNRSLDEFSNDPFRSILNLFSKKSKKNAIDEYVEQQEKEEKAKQKALSDQQKEEQKAKYEEQKRLEKEQKEILKRQKEEEKEILKAKEAQEKELEKLKKLEIKQKEDEKKRIAQEKEDARKEKEKAYKLQQKQKEDERKEKDHLRKEEQKKREEERKALQKQKEEERKIRDKQREAERKEKEKQSKAKK